MTAFDYSAANAGEDLFRNDSNEIEFSFFQDEIRAFATEAVSSQPSLKQFFADVKLWKEALVYEVESYSCFVFDYYFSSVEWESFLEAFSQLLLSSAAMAVFLLFMKFFFPDLSLEPLSWDEEVAFEGNGTQYALFLFFKNQLPSLFLLGLVG